MTTANININDFLFTRTSPKKKLEDIEGLTASQLLGIKEETVKRIIKEAGRGWPKSRSKTLRLSSIHQTGNSWNSTIDSWDLFKGSVWIDFYVQYENTDTNTSETFSKFIRRGEFLGQMLRDDRYGNPRTYYFRYDEGAKARAIRALLLEYVHTKYADKL